MSFPLHALMALMHSDDPHPSALTHTVPSDLFFSDRIVLAKTQKTTKPSFTAMQPTFIASLLALGTTAIFASAQEATISVHAEHVLHRVTPYLTGACIEDVNHEVYGGIYSQMIFGESFAEPAPQPPLKDFKAYGGRWAPLSDGSLESAAGD